MAITWNTPGGSLGIITERVIQDITIQATSTVGNVTYSLIAGNLPRGLRLSGNRILGSPTEVRKFTESRFVIRADDGNDIEDRTFSISVDGDDLPEWITREGFLNVGDGDSYFVLDNAYVNFQLEATDTDLISGDNLEYYLLPSGGVLPPGLSLSKDGVISGFTDPIFALEYTGNPSGAYGIGSYDTMPLDSAEAKSNGFDSYYYDNVTYDYNEPSRVPRRLSRIYTFALAVTDGANAVTRIFKIYVVTEEFLKADNSIVQVDTNLFRADSSSNRKPIWITESNLGRFRANNYVTIFLDVYDPPTLAGTITYFLLPTNPDGTVSEIPPGMELDSMTGEIAGKVPYQARVKKTYAFSMLAVNFPAIVSYNNYTLKGSWNSYTTYEVNDAVTFGEILYVCLIAHRSRTPTSYPTYWEAGVSSAEKTFTVDVVGEIESAIDWVTDNNLGSIKPNQPSTLSVFAESLLYGGRVTYEFVNGALPPGLEFVSNGNIVGKVKQFSDNAGAGLTRFFEKEDQEGWNSSKEDSSLIWRNFSTSTFDGGVTSFDKKFTFTIRARDSVNFAVLDKTFSVTVISDTTKTFANLYVKAFQTKEKRLEWYNFITDSTIFSPADIYRYGDNNFGIQPDLKMLVYAGIESVEAVKYVQAMSRNHYNKRLRFGEIKTAKAKDFTTQETIYEVIYVDIIDDYEKNGASISNTIELADNINSKVLISYDSIKIDSDIPLVSDSDHQRIFPNSIKNMRNRLNSVGERDREFLPLWMRSIQDTATYETGYVKSLVLCYCKPGKSAAIIARIKAKAFDFKKIDFEADRYVIDIIDGQIEDKYLAFPQRGEKLP